MISNNVDATRNHLRVLTGMCIYVCGIYITGAMKSQVEVEPKFEDLVKQNTYITNIGDMFLSNLDTSQALA